MANARAGNVLVVDTSAQFDGCYEIESIKYIGASTSSATVKADSTSGTAVWEEAASTNVTDEVCVNLRNGMYVAITGTAKVYIYLK